MMQDSKAEGSEIQGEMTAQEKQYQQEEMRLKGQQIEDLKRRLMSA